MTIALFTTSGDGHWSNKVTHVKCIDYTVHVYDEEAGSGELRVYFDTTTWNTAEDGLIYTDTRFLHQLKQYMLAHGVDPDDVYYSEQGMQGTDFVSLDFSEKFYSSWARWVCAHG